MQSSIKEAKKQQEANDILSLTKSISLTSDMITGILENRTNEEGDVKINSFSFDDKNTIERRVADLESYVKQIKTLTKKVFK